MRQLQLFTTAELAGMRDRTKSRNYSPSRDEFRRTQQRHRSWGLARRHAERLQRVRNRPVPASPQPTSPNAGQTPARSVTVGPARSGRDLTRSPSTSTRTPAGAHQPDRWQVAPEDRRRISPCSGREAAAGARDTPRTTECNIDGRPHPATISATKRHDSRAASKNSDSSANLCTGDGCTNIGAVSAGRTAGPRSSACRAADELPPNAARFRCPLSFSPSKSRVGYCMPTHSPIIATATHHHLLNDAGQCLHCGADRRLLDHRQRADVKLCGQYAHAGALRRLPDHRQRGQVKQCRQYAHAGGGRRPPGYRQRGDVKHCGQYAYAGAGRRPPGHRRRGGVKHRGLYAHAGAGRRPPHPRQHGRREALRAERPPRPAATRTAGSTSPTLSTADVTLPASAVPPRGAAPPRHRPGGRPRARPHQPRARRPPLRVPPPDGRPATGCTRPAPTGRGRRR